MAVEGTMITVPTGDREIAAFRARPSGDGPFPLVLVIEEIFGIHNWIKAVCRRLAAAGYCAIAPDLFARQGDPTKLGDITAIIRDIVSKVSDAQVMGDLDATVRAAAASGAVDAARVGITGFCWGGRIVWMYAGHNPALKAAVAWYGPVARAYHGGDRSAQDVVGAIRAPVLGLYGGDDPGIPVETTRAIADAMRAAGKTAEIVVYPDAPHGFCADYRPSYREGPAEDGWKRMLEWFERYL